jgi:hypothetical protein
MEWRGGKRKEKRELKSNHNCMLAYMSARSVKILAEAVLIGAQIWESATDEKHQVERFCIDSGPKELLLARIQGQPRPGRCGVGVAPRSLIKITQIIHRIIGPWPPQPSAEYPMSISCSQQASACVRRTGYALFTGNERNRSTRNKKKTPCSNPAKLLVQ